MASFLDNTTIIIVVVVIIIQCNLNNNNNNFQLLLIKIIWKFSLQTGSFQILHFDVTLFHLCDYKIILYILSV